MEEIQIVEGKNIWFFNTGSVVPDGDRSRNWEACKIYGFVSAGQTKKDCTYARKPKTKDILCCYESGMGYVGIGVVERPALPINQFKLADGKSLRNLPNIIMGGRRANGLFNKEEDPILCEQVLKVSWKVIDKTYLNLGRNDYGFYAPINTCMPLNDKCATLKVLQKYFKVEFKSDYFKVDC